MIKRLFVFLISTVILGASFNVFAEDAQIESYDPSGNAYVPPPYPSSPNSGKWKIYGPSQNTFELIKPFSRDYDKDGTSNYLDFDDDNDVIWNDNV